MPSQSGLLFLLDAPGGTGKTFVPSAIQDFLRAHRKQVIPVATSAATLPNHFSRRGFGYVREERLGARSAHGAYWFTTTKSHVSACGCLCVCAYAFPKFRHFWKITGKFRP